MSCVKVISVAAGAKTTSQPALTRSRNTDLFAGVALLTPNLELSGPYLRVAY